jgi:DNA-directed RNA polymerase subunit RPC12/RpoP
MTQQTLDDFEETVRCPSCVREFETKKAMRIHHAQLHDESLTQRDDRYRCSVCGREVNTERGLTNHLAKVHPETWDDLQDAGVVLELANE